MGVIAGAAIAAGTAVLSTTASYLNMRQQQKFAAGQQKDLLAAMGGQQGLFGTSEIAGDLANSLFTGGAGSDLVDFLTNRLPLTKAEKQSAKFFNRQAMPMVNEGVANLKTLYPYADELVRTGFPTDIQPLIDREQYRLQNETIPGIFEDRFNMLGQGSGIASLGMNAASDVGNTLGALRYAAQEAATGRRVAGLPLAAEIYQQPTQFALQNVGIIGQQGELGRIRAESARNGALPPVPSTLSLLPSLAGAEQGQVFPVMPGQQSGTSGFGAAPYASLAANALGGIDWSKILGGGQPNYSQSLTLSPSFSGGGYGSLNTGAGMGGSYLSGGVGFGSDIYTNPYANPDYNPSGLSGG
jgi:hypothetical protein